MSRFLACAFLLATFGPALPARAAEDTAVCTGFISTVPVVISEQGTWCLTQDVATGITSGAAILVQANNVVLDCNNFKIGGLSAGPGTSAFGVLATNRQNITIRRCNIRGFRIGTYLAVDGAVLEDSRLEGNTERGTYIDGDSNVIRRNFVLDTGGTTGAGEQWAVGISAYGDVDVRDNTITGAVATPGGNGRAQGIIVGDHGVAAGMINISDNRIRGLVADGTASAGGINNYSNGRITVRDNVVFGAPGSGDYGIVCFNSSNTGDVSGNSLVGTGIPIYDCGDDGDNVIKP